MESKLRCCQPSNIFIDPLLAEKHLVTSDPVTSNPLLAEERPVTSDPLLLAEKRLVMTDPFLAESKFVPFFFFKHSTILKNGHPLVSYLMKNEQELLRGEK